MKWLISILLFFCSFSLKAQSIKKISYTLITHTICRAVIVNMVVKTDTCFNEENTFTFKRDTISQNSIHYPIYKNEIVGSKIILYTGLDADHTEAVFVVKFYEGGNITISMPINDGKEFLVESYPIALIKKNE